MPDSKITLKLHRGKEIFLQLRFDVKSILVKFEYQKTAILTLLEGQDFNFDKNSVSNSKFYVNEIVKMAVFWDFKIAKTDFT